MLRTQGIGWAWKELGSTKVPLEVWGRLRQSAENCGSNPGVLWVANNFFTHGRDCVIVELIIKSISGTAGFLWALQVDGIEVGHRLKVSGLPIVSQPHRNPGEPLCFSIEPK